MRPLPGPIPARWNKNPHDRVFSQCPFSQGVLGRGPFAHRDGDSFAFGQPHPGGRLVARRDCHWQYRHAAFLDGNVPGAAARSLSNCVSRRGTDLGGTGTGAKRRQPAGAGAGHRVVFTGVLLGRQPDDGPGTAPAVSGAGRGESHHRSLWRFDSRLCLWASLSSC